MLLVFCVIQKGPKVQARIQVLSTEPTIPLFFVINTKAQLDWNISSGLTQLLGGIVMYYLLYRNQLHVSALFIGHLQVDNEKINKQLHSICVCCI